MQRFTKGCSCSKNSCQKNYCECFKYGLPCTPLCRCENCCNETADLAPEVVARLSKRTSRKKKKIIFLNLDRAGGRGNLKQHIVVSKHRH